MSKLASTIVSEAKGEFEGGVALDVNWNSLLQQALETTLNNINPEPLKRRAPIYGGLTEDVNTHYCPDDVHTPSSLFPNDGKREYRYQPSKAFHENEEEERYTIEHINGTRFLMVRHGQTSDVKTVEDFEDTDGLSGDPSDIALNQTNYVSGSGAVEATFSDTDTDISGSLSDAIDISDHLRGVAIVPAYWSDASIVSSVELRLETDASNYYSVTSTADSIGDNFIDDQWNLIRFSMANSSTQGSPTASNITQWTLKVTMNSGQSQKVIIDKITVQESAVYYLEYYSTKGFIDGSTGAWKDTVSYKDSDKVRLSKEELGIYHYELCKLVSQNSSEANQSETRFDNQLARKYQNYFANRPSSEMPPTYNEMPNIGFDHDMLSGDVT